MPPPAAIGLRLGHRRPLGAGSREDELDGEGASPLSALARRAQQGDDGAFEDLMRETQPRVMSLAWRLLGSRDRARDAAQETYFRAFRYLGRFRPDRDFESWICRIAVNVCRDLHRRGTPGSGKPLASYEAEREAGRLEEPSCGASAEAELLESERTRLLLDAVAALPPRQRAALVLRDLEGMTSERAASILGSTAGTIRAQVAAARLRLKRALGAERERRVR